MFEAILGGIAAGGVSSLIGAKGAKDAANTQAAAADRASAVSERQFDISRADLAPYRSAGSAALSVLRSRMGLDRAPSTQVRGQISRENFDGDAYLAANPDVARAGVDPYQHYLEFGIHEGRAGFQLGDASGATNSPLLRKFTMEDFEADPVTQLSMRYGLDEGNKAVRRMLGATGMARSGAAVKALTRFNQDYAGSKAAESRSRFIQDQDVEFNRLSGVAGTGQTATMNTATLGANAANQIGQNIIGAGNARGAAAIAGANAIAAPISAAGNTLTTKYLLDSMSKTPRTPNSGLWFGE